MTVDPEREQDEFDRMRLTARIDRARGLIAQYEEGLAHYRGDIEDSLYALGRLDEKLGGEPQ